MPVRPQTPPKARAVAIACAGLLACALLSAFPAGAYADSQFAISGRGWGHGIGMTQYGAMGYAQQGKTYDWILAHYFQQTTLATRPELTVMVDLDASKAARSSWRIAAASSATTLTISDAANATHSVDVKQGTIVWIAFSGGGAVLKTDKSGAAGSVVATFPGAVVASTASIKDSKVRLLGTSGPFSQTSVAWRGQVRFTPHDKTSGNAIDYVPMEQYLRGVVPRESPSSWPVEALRAQAVAARSYAYDAASAGSVLWCTTQSQVYNGAGSDAAGTDHETSKTDAAVADTADQFVVYGSTVVQTFFSSSSGGHTANIEDVWLGSTPKVYYTGVADADDVSGNPNYRWTLADMSGTTLAGKIRDHYASLAHPAPARVTTVTLEIGTSGFVRHVTVHWSSGSDTLLTGTQMQSALGMKSSAYTITLKNPPLPATTRFEQTDSHVRWSGTWTAVKATSASGGTYKRASSASSSVTVAFKGSRVVWIGSKGPRSGKATVTLDGKLLATVDLYAAKTAYKATIWTKTGLAADTTHTLLVKVLGKHRTGSGASDVAVDAFDVAGTLFAVPIPASWKRYEQNSSAVAYTGAWTTAALAGMSGGTHAYSRTASATATFSFTGSGVRWIGKKATNYGKAWVSVDSSTATLVDLYATRSLNQQRLFSVSGLTSGPHTLRIRVAGTKNAKSTKDYVDVDAFEALHPAT
jgi:stage II sporulation protein D